MTKEYKSNKPQGFTLIELMVVIAIIAILAVVGMAIYSVVNARARDAIRLSDFANISQAIHLTIHNSSNLSADLCFNTQAPCSGISTSSDPNIRKTNGSGWIKVNLDQDNLANFDNLPIDPLNDSSFFYSYSSDGTNWRIEAVLESDSYKDRMQSDNGSDPNKYEVGSKVIEN